MSDLISRADAIEAVREVVIDNDAVEALKALPSAEQVTSKLNNPCDSLLTDDSAECKEQKSKLDLISRADVLKYPIRLDHYDEVNGSREFVYGVESVIEYVESLPSAVADGEDLIIKGAKGIQDGVYNIKDGEIFKYKAKGGTVRSYPIVPSADRPTEDYSDPPDIPRAYYEKIVGNMSHEINMLKQQLEDRPTHERDLISRHEALMELNGACEMWEDDAIVADIIHKLPSIEIVRCKDCYYYDKGENESESWQYCTYTRVAVNDDGFCSWAVMKGGTE